MHTPEPRGDMDAVQQSLKTRKAIAAAIGWILILGAIGAGIFIKNIDQAYGAGNAVFRYIVLAFVTGFTLWQWADNDFKLEIDSVPPLFRIGGAFVFAFFLLWLNLEVCKFRLGIPHMSFMFLPTILLHLLTLLIGVGIVAGSHFTLKGKRAPKWRSAVAIALSVAAVLGLNMIFTGEVGDVGDLTTKMLPTLTCYPGGTCYNSGMGAWGGEGTTFLMLANFLQGILVFNVLFGLYLFAPRIAKKNRRVRGRK